MDEIVFNPWQAVLQIFVHPKKTTAAILQSRRSGWLIPMLITTLLLLVSGIVQQQLVNQQNALEALPMMDPNAAGMAPAMLGGGGGMVVMGGGGSVEGLSPEGEALPAGTSPLKGILDLTARLSGFWLSWLILSILLHVGLMMSGGNLQQRAIFQLTAWASLVFALRGLVQVIFMEVSQQPILGDGLSGLVPLAADQPTLFSFILGGLDLYFLAQLGLIYLGIQQVNHISSKKLSLVILANGLLVLFLAALPPFVLSRILQAVSSTGGLF